MNGSSDGQRSGTRPLLALWLTLITQAMASMALMAPSVFAPVVAPLLGYAPQSIGLFVGAIYLAAMFSGLIGGHYVRQIGAIRLSQVAMALACIGLLLAALAVPALLLLATLAIGIGYGLTNPTAAHILSHHVPIARRGVFFSIKQTGVPIGVALAGLLVPLFLKWWFWPGAVAAVAAVVAATILLLAPYRHTFDVSEGVMGLNLRAMLARPLARVMRDPPLRQLGLTSFCYSGAQICFLTFLVSDLKLERGFSLAHAALALAAAQITSIAARPLWGYIADHFVDPRTLLGLLGLGMAASLALLGLLPAATNAGLVFIVTLLVAATVVGWNGVYFAGLARQTRPDEIAMVTGGTQFLTFSGAMVAPVVFAAAVSMFGSYATSFLLLGLFPLLVGIWLLRQARQSRAEIK